MRYALHYERGQTGRDYAARGLVMSNMAFPTGLGLELATMGGAQALGLDHLIGSITPGKQADLVMVRRDRLSLSPLHDPVKTLVMMAGAGDVDGVFVAGKPVKRHGRLLRKDLPYLLNDLAASHDHLQRAVDAMDVARARSIATQLFPVE